MNLKKLELHGAVLVEPVLLRDERGHFTTVFGDIEFAALGLPTAFKQANCSFNAKKGTLRGMHYQAAPMAQPKLVRCTRGAIYDVIIDLRPESSTYCRWLAVELNEENAHSLFIPAGFAHGFQTLRDGTEVFYLMGERYSPEHGRGVRWNDPAFGIDWPAADRTIAPRDATYPDFQK